jgi:hypothetical protein
MDKGMTCLRKQLAIYDHLKKTTTLDYLNALSFLAEMQREIGDCKSSV